MRQQYESVVLVEPHGSVIDRVNDNRSGAVVSGSREGTHESILEEITPETGSLFAAVEGEASQEQDRNRIGLPSSQARRREASFDASHGDGVVAHDSLAAAQDPRGRCTGGSGGRGRPAQPVIEAGNPTVEAFSFMAARVQ